jgi:DNA-binding MarR family transcriptional regulator
MDANRTPSRPPRQTAAGAAGAARELIELLEVLWERGRDLVPPAPVSASQLRVLYSLDHEEGMNLRTLGELLDAAPPSVSRLCDRLEALGLVRRLPSAHSRRELELHLTGRGKAYLRDLRARRQEALEEVIATMTPSDRRALLNGLTSFQDAVDDVGPAPWRKPSTGDVRSA